MSITDIGEKFHIITRRGFEDDLRRHFVGKVVRMDGGLVELQGYTFVWSNNTNEFRRRRELRTRVFGLGEAGHIVNKLPADLNIEAGNRLVMTDGDTFSLDINEFTHTR